jgi:hypothetical protein
MRWLIACACRVNTSLCRTIWQRLKQKMEKGCQVRFDETGAISSFTPRPPLSGQ